MSYTHARHFVLSLGLLLATTGTALAQPAAASGGWDFTIYPVLAWVPTSIDIEVNVPPPDVPGGGGGGGEEPGSGGGKIIDGRLDGAYLGGFSATNGTWRIDGDGLWAAVGGDRVNTPKLRVDVDVIYAHGTVGRRIFNDFYVTGGVRRMALKYDILVLDKYPFERKPGLWDPVVGVAYHRVRNSLELHGTFEGGGFGVGSDSEYAASLRADWKPVRHFGLTAGYSFLTFKVTNEVLRKTLIAEQTLHGPVLGFGLYF